MYSRKVFCVLLAFSNISIQAQIGTHDAAFTAAGSPNAVVEEINVLADGKILISGSFTQYSGQNVSRVALLEPDGSLNTTFNANIGLGPNLNVFKQSVMDDGRIVLGGSFDLFDGNPAVRVTRLNEDGTRDATFSTLSGPNSDVLGIAVQPDDKIVIVGNFTMSHGNSAPRIARLNANGSFDNSFLIGSGFNGIARTIHRLDNGKFIVAGGFTSYNGVTTGGLVRLNEDGTLDNTFINGSGVPALRDVAILSGDKMLVAGFFTNYLGTPINNLVLLNADGSIDNSFNPGTSIDNVPYTVIAQDDGKFLVGGLFYNYQGVPSQGLVRINPDGSRDATLNIGAGFDLGHVFAMAVQSDGKIVIGGDYLGYNLNYTIQYLCRIFGACNTTNTINAGACTSYSLNGITYTTSGTYIQTIPNTAGCDSIITLNLSVATSNCGLCIVGDYRFNNSLLDISGFNNHGTSNSPIAAADRFGNQNSAYETTVTQGKITLGNPPEYQFGGSDFTINVWINKLQPTDGTGDHEYGIGAWDDYFNFGDNEWMIRLTDFSQSNAPSFRFEDNLGSTYQLLSNVEMNLGQWYMLTAQRNADMMHFFVNGVLKDSEVVGTNFQLNSKNLPITIGASSSDQYGTNARFDDVKIFNCALTQAQIDSIYQSEAPASLCDLLISSVNPTSPTCFNGMDGSVNINVSGGTLPYSFLWNTGTTSQNLINIGSGSYNVVVTDDDGCSKMTSVTVSNPSPIQVNVNTVNATCLQSDGTANLNITGGTAPFTYQWSSGDTLASASNLAAGHYMVSVYDANGCYGAQMFGVSNVGGPQLFFSANNETCPGNSDGAINLMIGTGNGPFTFIWSNGETSEDLSQVPAGHYDVMVTDVNGCITVAFVDVESSPAINLTNYTFTTASCGQNDGEITVNGFGGYGILDYSWNTGATGNTISGIGAGAYYITAIDGHGCSETFGIMLNDASGPGVTVQSITPIDCNGNGGNVDVNITSGIPPFTYNWNNGAYTTQDLTGVAAGTYDLTVTGNDGCKTMIQVNVPGLMPLNTGICIVSVDTTTITNLVIWEKPASANGIHYYTIYREGSAAGVYTKIDTVHFNSLSQWTDPTANPRIRSWRYRISATDSCGVESMLSPVHKTVHLTISPGVGQSFNLIWDNYVGESFPTWYINRWHASTGWIQIDAIPRTLQSYTDFNIPVQGGFVDYSIEGGPINCTATRAINHNTTRSNKQNNVAAPNSVPETLIISLGVYPNPTNGEITVSGMFAQDLNWSIAIVDLAGRIVLENINGRGSDIRQTINLQQLATGMYQLRLTGDGFDKTMQVVKQ